MGQQTTQPMGTVWQFRQSESSHCEGCPGCDSPYPLGGIGDPDADVMLVGMEPAYNVDEVTVDMDDTWEQAKRKMELERESSNNPLWRHMENVALAIDVSPLDLYFTNVAKCGNGDFEERVDHCENYLAAEITAVNPQVLLLHGGKCITVAGDILGLDFGRSVGAVHGELFEMRSFDVLPLYHWGYVYRQGNVTEYNSLVAKRVAEVLR